MRTTALYAALLALLYLAITVGVLRARYASKIALGTGEDRGLFRAARAHANFAEYVPLILVLMVLAESGGAPRLLVHAIGLATLVGRSLHAYGIRQEPEPLAFRMSGMILTLTALGVAAFTTLVVALF